MSVSVSILVFRAGKRQRCELCNQRKFVSRLALFHEDGLVLGELQLCEQCTEVLEDALLHGAIVQEVGLACRQST